MDENRKVTKDELYNLLDRQKGWIENCDTKSSIMLGIIGVILAIFLVSDYMTVYGNILKSMIDILNFNSFLYLTLSVLSIISFITGAIYTVCALIGRTGLSTHTDKSIKKDSLIFFGTIASNNDFQSFRDKFYSFTEDDVNEDILSQIYVCALICNKKFAFYKRGVILSFVGFGCFAILLIVGICIV